MVVRKFNGEKYMKNKFVFLISLAILFVSILGCSYYNPLEGSSNSAANDNRALSNKAIDSNVSEQKVGVPECDELFESFAQQYRAAPEDDFVTKAARDLAIGAIREQLMQKLEEHRGDKEAMRRDCREIKTQLDRYKTEESNKQQ
jgi:hypothetical protein